MKKLLLAAGIAAFAFLISATPTVSVQAQQTKLVVKTITGVDTVTFANVPSKMRSLEYTYTETTGTSAGYVILEATTNGTWFSLDTLTLADVTTAQKFKFTFTTGTNYLSYRYRNTNSSAATGVVRAAYLRRTDD